ncbi:MAG: hypothetical protein RR528_01530 [Angelakisella sp.]
MTETKVFSDLHSRNINGPVYSLPRTMDKMLALGIPLVDCVDMVTGRVAEIYKLAERGLGQLTEGALAELTIFRLADGRHEYVDADGNSIQGNQYIDVAGVFVGDRLISRKKEEV